MLLFKNRTKILTTMGNYENKYFVKIKAHGKDNCNRLHNN